MKKKIFGLLLVLLLAMVGTACNITTGENGEITINPGGNNEVKVDLDEVYLNVQSQIANKDNITSDVTLPTKFGTVTVSWASDNPNIIDANGHIVRPDEDTDVILHCTLTNGSDTKTYQLKLTIKAKEVVVDVSCDIRTVISSEVGKSYKTKGTVVAVSKTGFIIKDGTGLILSYLDSFAEDLVAGDVVEVEGTTSLYGGAVQFNKPSYNKVGSEAVSYPTARVLDKDSYEALNTENVTLEYVSLRGKLTISGRYYNITVDDSAVKGSICAPLIDVTSLDGKYVDFTGYFVYVSGTSTKYIYFMVTDIKESDDQGGGEPPIELTFSTIEEVKAGTVGDKYKVQAVVVAVSGVSALVQDSTGYILLYFGNEFRKDLVVGDEIVVEGTTSVYRDTVQFSSGKYEKVGTKAVSYPEPIILDGASMDALVDATPVTKFVKIAGKLVMSGNYVNLEVKGATNMGSVVTPLEDLSDYVDKNVIISGFYLYVTGSSTKYVYFILTSIELDAANPTYTIAKLDEAKQGTYYGDGVVVIITESKVAITDPTGKTLEFDIYAEDDKYFILEEGTKVYCTFGDGTVTNNHGTFKKDDNTQPTYTVAKLDEAKQGTYYGDGVVVVVEESKVKVTDPTGKTLEYVIYQEDDKFFVLDDGEKVYCTFGDGTVTNNYGTFSKEKPETPVSTIQSVKAGTVGGEYKVKAVVVATSAVSFLLQDETGYILVYLGNSNPKDVIVGDELELLGKTGTYRDTVQFTTAEYTKVGTKNVNYPEAEELTADSMTALGLATPVVKFVKVSGKVAISGNYVNLTVEGTDYVGSVVSPINSLSDYNDKDVVVTGYFLYVTGSSTKYINIIMTNIELVGGSDQPPVELPISTVAEVKSGEIGAKYKVKAVVVAASSVSVLLKDDSGYILVYFGSSYAKDLLVGDEIELEGATSIYKETVQFNGGSYTKVGTKDVIHPEAEELNYKAIDIMASATPVTTYVKISGKLAISGSYVNLAIDGTEIVGSVVSPLEDLSDYNDKDVVVTGYFLYVTGSSTRYFNVIMTNIEVVGGTNNDEEIVDEIIASYSDFSFIDVVNNLILPEGSDGVTMTWVSTNEAVLESDGTYHMPSEPTDVTFILTVSKGEVSKSTRVTFHIVGVETIASVKANVEYGSYHIIKGITIATAREGFLIKDDTGIIYCSTASYRGDLEIGDEVIVKGPSELYGNVVQITKYELNYEKTGEKAEVIFPEPIVLDADAFASLFETTEIIYVQVSGTLEAGEYLSILNVEGTEIVGGLLYPSLMEYDGMEITVKGYFIDSVCGYKQFNQIVVTDVTIDSAGNVDQNKVSRVVEDILSLDGETVYFPMNYVCEYEGVTVTWTSSNADLFTFGVLPGFQEEETSVELAAVVSCGEVSETVTISLIVPAITKIANITAEDAEQFYVTQGVVVAETRESILLQDESGMIVVYFGKNNKPENITVGTELIYVGTVTTYAGIIEFNYGGYKVLGNVELSYPEATELTGEEVDALIDSTEIIFVTITGDLSIDGNYINFYPVDSDAIASLISPIVDLSEHNGERLVITGYYVYTAGSSTKYPSFMLVDYAVYEWSDEEIVADIKSTIDGFQNIEVFGGVTVTFGGDAIITWSSSHEDILSSEFVYNVPEVDTLVTLTATITKGEVTDTAVCTFLCKAPLAISTVLEAEDLNNRFLVKGVVVATSQVSFLVKDETGLILAYYGYEYPQDLEIGDIVYLRGYVYDYSGVRQFGKNVGYTKTGEKEEVVYNEPITLDASSFDELLNSTEIKFVKLTATLHINGSYYNLEVAGSENNGSIIFPTDDDLSLVDGATISLTGYYLYTSGSETKYISFIATSLDYEVGVVGTLD